jgi:lipopolysaccharide export system permease protein
MLPIIDRYILREVTKSFLAILFVLLLILVGSGYMRLLGDAASGNIGNDIILNLVAIEALRVMAPITPPAFFLAILYTLGQMYRHSEMTALFASGVGSGRLFRAVILAALPVVLLVSWLSLDLRPWANGQRDLVLKQRDIQSEFNSAVAGRFNESKRGNLVFYVEGVSDDRKRLQQVFVQNRQHGKLGLIVSDEGYQHVDPESGEQFIVLRNGRRYEGEPGRNDFTIGEFEEYGVKIALEQQAPRGMRVRSLSTPELFASEVLAHKVELQYRFMLPLAVLVFTVISVPLSHGQPREGFYGRIVLAILFYLLFVNLIALSEAWMASGATPLWMGRWWVHLLMLALAGAFAYYRSNHLDRLLRRLRG